MKSLFKRLIVMLMLSVTMLAIMYTCSEKTNEYKIEYFKFKSGEYIPYDLPDTKYHVYTIIDGQTVATRGKPAAAKNKVNEAFNGFDGLVEHFGDLFAGCAWEGADFVYYITEFDADMAQELADIGEYDDFVFCKVKYPYSELAALRDRIFDYGVECNSSDFFSVGPDQKLNKIELLIMEDNLIHEKIAAKLKEWASPDMYIIEKYPAIIDQTAADEKKDIEDRAPASGN